MTQSSQGWNHIHFCLHLHYFHYNLPSPSYTITLQYLKPHHLTPEFLWGTPTYSKFATTGLWSLGLQIHIHSNVVAMPLSLMVKCFFTFTTQMWFPNAYIKWYDLAFSVGDMDMCIVSWSIVSSPWIVEAIEAFSRVGNGGNS